MREVVRIVEELRSTSSTNSKLDILKANKENTLLQRVLEYTYNPFKRYGLSEKILDKAIEEVLEGEESSFVNIFECLDKLANSNINDKLRNDVAKFLHNREGKELYKCMILKDLKIGLNVKSINKVFKDLIPEFNVMLAEGFFKQKEGFLNNREFIITTKLDGIRCVIIKEKDNIKLYSRQGQLIEGLVEIKNELININGNFVLDGELLLRNDNNLPSDELYRETVKVVRKDGIKKNVEFHAFDMIPVDSFKRGKEVVACSIRKKTLHDFIKENSFEYIVEVPILYQGEDENKIMELLDIAKSNNQEGIMLNLSDAPYECKRSKGILKVKVMNTGDMRVLNVIEGTGVNKGKLGSITVQFEHEGELHTCDCGSGFSKEERSLYWDNPELILGKIVEIQYFEISKNKQGGVGLRFPVWKSRIRESKTEISMH